MTDDYGERRKHQRFLARRGEQTIFWLLLGTERIPLVDLSLEGFSYAAESPPAIGSMQSFELRLDGIPDKIRGQMEAINLFPGNPASIVGCRFVSLEGCGNDRLHEWLTTHVIACASVRITAGEAEKIVKGPSLI